MGSTICPVCGCHVIDGGYAKGGAVYCCEACATGDECECSCCQSVHEKILTRYKTIAMVGASPDPERDSYWVFDYLHNNGFNVIPVNPNYKEVQGKKSYPDLQAIPEPIEVVDIFRRSEYVLPIVSEAIEVGAKAIWMQEGVINEEAARRAQEAGLFVVMNRCMKKEHQKLAQKS